jgi:ABC-type bacteriocin/lantibiotic exporter with double-glycine peptidase domain
MAVLFSLWRILDPHQRRQLLGLQLLSVVMGLSTVGGIAAVLPFFTALNDPNAVRHNAVLRLALQHLHFADDRSFVIALGLGFAAVVLIANAINLFGFLAINRFAFRVGDTLYVRLFNEYMYREYEFHTRNNSSKLASNVLQETSRVTSGILQQALILVTNLVIIACIVASIVVLNPLVAIVAFFGLGASYAVIYVIARGRLLRNGQAESRFYAARALTVNESFAAIKEVTIAQARDFFVQRFAAQCRTISRVVCDTLAISQTPKYVLECVTICCLAGIAVYLRSRTAAGDSWMAQLSFVGFAAYRLLPALQQAFTAIVKIRAEHPAFAGIEIDLERAQHARATARPVVLDREWNARPRREIRVCDVSFRHAPDRPAAVSDLSLVIPAGAIVGFSGPNGSGKTTLLDIVSGLLVPQSGYIEVDGIRLDRTNCAAWQSTIAYVPQQVFLFDATLAENIAFGIPPAQIDPGRLEIAVRLARLTECVADLPNGYQERLGERGCRLSGGQRQRLAIARALYRDASLLILDEATSALDIAAEAEIIEMLETLRPNRTILVIAHRTGALRHCDLVFDLSKGRITGVGKYGQIVPVKTHATNIR